MKAGASTEKQVVIPDEKLVQLYRDDRAAHIWPSLQASDAVLRALDTELAKHPEQAAQGQALEQAKADVEHLQRQLTLANSIIETYQKTVRDLATASGIDIDPATVMPAPL